MSTSILALSLILSGCGGGSGSSAVVGTGVTPTPTPTPTACSLRSRQDFAFAALDQWYLFPETLPASLDPSPYTNVSDYLDALTATARAQNRDRFFTYLTSIAQENAFNATGASAGIGIRLSNDVTAKRTFIIEAFEGAPGLAAGLDRGVEILAIGDTAASLRTVTDIITAEGAAGVSNALGPSTAGVTRVLRIKDRAGVTRDVSVTKATFDLPPISSRYGALVLNDGGKKVAYINLRTFITAADSGLTSAFANFKSQGITEFVIDLRYNGGGLLSTAELFGDLLGGGRSTSDVFTTTTFRPSKSSNNTTKRFAPRSESIAPTKIAFIGTGSTASASELVMNGMIPYLNTNEALIGTNTYGKPVGQVALDNASCDDRFRVLAFSYQNAAGTGFFYNGIAANMPRTCQAADDFTKPFGDPTEASIKTALDFLGGRACTAITAGVGQSSQSLRDSGMKVLEAANPTAAQQQVPGLF